MYIILSLSFLYVLGKDLWRRFYCQRCINIIIVTLVIFWVEIRSVWICISFEKYPSTVVVEHSQGSVPCWIQLLWRCTALFTNLLKLKLNTAIYIILGTSGKLRNSFIRTPPDFCDILLFKFIQYYTNWNEQYRECQNYCNFQWRAGLTISLKF